MRALDKALKSKKIVNGAFPPRIVEDSKKLKHLNQLLRDSYFQFGMVVSILVLNLVILTLGHPASMITHYILITILVIFAILWFIQIMIIRNKRK